MVTLTPYHARRRRKVRLITGIGMSLLAIAAIVLAIGWTAIIVEAANANDLTFTIAGLTCPVPPETFETLRAFTATLKPNYTPP